MTGETIPSSYICDTVHVMRYLSALDIDAEFELIMEHPELGLDEWAEQIDRLEQLGVYPAAVGGAIELYPDLLDEDVTTTEEDIEQVNLIVAAVKQLKAENPSLYYKYIVQNYEEKLIRLQNIGATLWQAYQDHPELDIPSIIVLAPQYFFELGDAKKQLLVDNLASINYCNNHHIDIDTFTTKQLQFFFGHMSGLDPEAEGFSETLDFLYRETVNRPRYARAKKLGFRPGKLPEGWLEFMDELPDGLPFYAGRRLRALYYAAGGDIAVVRNALATMPEFFTTSINSDSLLKAGILSSEGLERYQRQMIRFSKGDRVSKAKPKNHPPHQRHNLELIRDVSTLSEIMDELDFRFTNADPREIAQNHPEILNVSRRLLRIRILALSATLGTQMARLIASMKPEILYGEKADRIIIDVNITDAQKLELRKELNRKSSAADHEAEMMEADKKELELLRKRPSLGAPVHEVISQTGLDADADQLILTSPRVVRLKPELAIIRVEQLVEILGTDRANAIVRKFPLYLSAQRGVEEIKSELTDVERVELRRRIKNINERRLRKLSADRA